MYQPTEYPNYFDDAAVISVKQNEDHLDLNLTLKDPDNVTLTEGTGSDFTNDNCPTRFT